MGEKGGGKSGYPQRSHFGLYNYRRHANHSEARDRGPFRIYCGVIGAVSKPYPDSQARWDKGPRRALKLVLMKPCSTIGPIAIFLIPLRSQQTRRFLWRVGWCPMKHSVPSCVFSCSLARYLELYLGT